MGASAEVRCTSCGEPSPLVRGVCWPCYLYGSPPGTPASPEPSARDVSTGTPAACVSPDNQPRTTDVE